MHQREVLAAGGAGFSDTMHVALGGVTVLLMFLTIGVGATAFGKPFRLYSIATVVVLLTFGALTFVEAPRLQANLPTPWIGLWERINFSRNQKRDLFGRVAVHNAGRAEVLVRVLDRGPEDRLDASEPEASGVVARRRCEGRIERASPRWSSTEFQIDRMTGRRAFRDRA
jgi:hypothetical protein